MRDRQTGHTPDENLCNISGKKNVKAAGGRLLTSWKRFSQKSWVISLNRARNAHPNES